MDVIDQKTDQELIESLIPELAKASNELKCAERDLAKIRSRLGFLTMIANRLKERSDEDHRTSPQTPTH
jgi:cell division FtsZ-interacting protein ZapD